LRCKSAMRSGSFFLDFFSLFDQAKRDRNKNQSENENESEIEFNT
jgi:hypothetical protein